MALSPGVDRMNSMIARSGWCGSLRSRRTTLQGGQVSESNNMEHTTLVDWRSPLEGIVRICPDPPTCGAFPALPDPF